MMIFMQVCRAIQIHLIFMHVQAVNLEEAIWRAVNEIKKGDKPHLRPLREERIAAAEIVPEASIFGGWLGYSVVMYEFTDEVAAAIRQQLESERE